MEVKMKVLGPKQQETTGNKKVDYHLYTLTTLFKLNLA